MLTIRTYTKKSGLKEIRKSELKKAIKSKANVWLDLTSPTNEEMAFVSQIINLHPITTEDIMELNPQIKYESFEEYTFVVFQSLKDIKEDEIRTAPLHLVISGNILLTARDDRDELVPKITDSKKLAPIMERGVDYLFHSLLDMGVDNYFPFVKRVTRNIRKTADEISSMPDRPNFDKLFDYKRVGIRIRSLVLNLTDLCARLNGPTNKFVRPSAKIYFRDILDHTTRLNMSLKEGNDEAISALNEHLALSSAKMNDIILVLTVFSAVMLPLTFVTGLYGMNVSLPFANSPLGFYGIVSIMVLIVLIMMIFFKRRRWI